MTCSRLVNDKNAGVLRLRMRIRKANPHASLRTTGRLGRASAAEAVFLYESALRGAEAPLFHNAAAVRACNVGGCLVHPAREKGAGDVELGAVSEAGEFEISRVSGGVAFAAAVETGEEVAG